MMHKTISDVGIKPIKVRPHERRSSSVSSASSRMVSRQASMSTNSGAEVYYYGDSSVSVPFRWESRPGTPKVDVHERRPLPPLTPPPSYLSSPARKPAKNHNSNGRILHYVIPKLSLIRKCHPHSSPSLSFSSSSSSSSSRSVRSSPCTPKSEVVERRNLGYHLSRKIEGEEEDDGYEEAHAGSLCFGIIGRASTSDARHSRGSSVKVIKLLLGENA